MFEKNYSLFTRISNFFWHAPEYLHYFSNPQTKNKIYVTLLYFLVSILDVGNVPDKV